MQIGNLKPADGARTKKVRIGRGIGSGIGKTSGRGQKGQNARSGGGVKAGFEGGNIPLIRKIPIRGFNNYNFRKRYSTVNVGDLEVLEPNTVVDIEFLYENRFIGTRSALILTRRSQIMFVKTGDKVRVIAGKDKGKEGTITKTVAGKDRVVVEGVNIVKKHQKPSNEYPQGGVIDIEAPIHVSNVQLLDPSTNEPTRVGFKVEDGKKVRVSKKSGNVLG